MSKIKRKDKKNTVICEILSANKSAKVEYVPFTDTEFSRDGNTYFIVPEGVYLDTDRQLRSVYLEGISLPLSHKNVEKEIVERDYEDKFGKLHKIKISLIKGLKFDSEILDILLNRGLAEKFAKVRVDRIQFVIIALLIINIITTIISVGVQFR